MSDRYLSLSEARDRQAEGVQAARDSIPESERDTMPTSMAAVKAWVGDDVIRAQQALDVEQEKDPDDQRAGLVQWLEKKVAGE